MTPRYDKKSLTGFTTGKCVQLVADSRSIHHIAEDNFFRMFGRKRLLREGPPVCRQGHQKNWALSTKQQQGNDKIKSRVTVIVADGDGTLVGWEWWDEVKKSYILKVLPDGAWIINGAWKPMENYPTWD